MIKPYYKRSSNAEIVEVEDFGVANLKDLPIKVKQGERGSYKLGWTLTFLEEGGEEYVLSEYGGITPMDFGGREIGVIREIK